MSENKEPEISPTVAAACDADLYARHVYLDKWLPNLPPFRDRFTVQDMLNYQHVWEPEA